MKLAGESSAIVAGVLSGSIGVFSTLLVAYGVSSLQQALFRILVPLLILTIFLFPKKQYFSVKKQDMKWFALLGFVAWPFCIVLYLTSFALGTPLAIAAFLLFLYPLHTAVLSPIFLKEKLKPTTIPAIVLAMAGLALFLEVWNFSFSSQAFLGYACAFLSGVGVCFTTMVARKLGKNYHQYTTVWYGLFFGLIFLIPLFFLLNAVLPMPEVSRFSLSMPLEAWAILLSFGLVTALLRNYFMYLSLRLLAATRAATLMMTEPLSAAVFGFLVFSQTLSSLSILGAVLIFAAVYIIATQK